MRAEKQTPAARGDANPSSPPTLSAEGSVDVLSPWAAPFDTTPPRELIAIDYVDAEHPMRKAVNPRFGKPPPPTPLAEAHGYQDNASNMTPTGEDPAMVQTQNLIETISKGPELAFFAESHPAYQVLFRLNRRTI